FPGAPTTTLPLWMYVAGSVKPISANASRRSVIGTRFFPPTLIPRNSTAHVCIARHRRLRSGERSDGVRGGRRDAVLRGPRRPLLRRGARRPGVAGAVSAAGRSVGGAA